MQSLWHHSKREISYRCNANCTVFHCVPLIESKLAQADYFKLEMKSLSNIKLISNQIKIRRVLFICESTAIGSMFNPLNFPFCIVWNRTKMNRLSFDSKSCRALDSSTANNNPRTFMNFGHYMEHATTIYGSLFDRVYENAACVPFSFGYIFMAVNGFAGFKKGKKKRAPERCWNAGIVSQQTHEKCNARKVIMRRTYLCLTS